MNLPDALPGSLVMSAARIYCFRCNAILSQQLSSELVFLLKQYWPIQNVVLALCAVLHCAIPAWFTIQSCPLHCKGSFLQGHPLVGDNNQVSVKP